MKSVSRWTSSSLSALCTSTFALAASVAQAQSAVTEEAYFCPAATTVHLGNTAPIACSGEHCVGGASTVLTADQKQFLESQKGDCRYLSDEEKDLLLPEKKPSM